MTITYNLIRSRRKTLAVEIKSDGQIIVRAPYRMPKKEIVAEKQNQEKKEEEIKVKTNILSSKNDKKGKK